MIRHGKQAQTVNLHGLLMQKPVLGGNSPFQRSGGQLKKVKCIYKMRIFIKPCFSGSFMFILTRLSQIFRSLRYAYASDFIQNGVVTAPSLYTSSNYTKNLDFTCKPNVRYLLRNLRLGNS